MIKLLAIAVVCLIFGYCIGFRSGQNHLRYTASDNQGNTFTFDTSITPLWPWEYSGWPFQFWPFDIQPPTKSGDADTAPPKGGKAVKSNIKARVENAAILDWILSMMAYPWRTA